MEVGKPHCLPFVKLEAQEGWWFQLKSERLSQGPRTGEDRQPSSGSVGLPFLCLFCSIQALNRWRVSAHNGEGDLPFSVPTQALSCTPSERRPYQLSAHPLVQASWHINLTITATAVPGQGGGEGHPLPQRWLLHLRNGPSLLPWDGWGEVTAKATNMGPAHGITEGSSRATDGSVNKPQGSVSPAAVATFAKNLLLVPFLGTAARDGRV